MEPLLLELDNLMEAARFKLIAISDFAVEMDDSSTDAPLFARQPPAQEPLVCQADPDKEAWIVSSGA
jgi:hypothetical protein